MAIVARPQPQWTRCMEPITSTARDVQRRLARGPRPGGSPAPAAAHDGRPRTRGVVACLRYRYAEGGRPSIPPEHLLRALLLQVLYSVRSERQLVEQLDYNLLFRWFVGLGVDDPIWVPTVFTKNRDRLLAGDIAQRFFDAVLSEAHAAELLSTEHFTVDGTLIQAWAGQKSFQRDPVKGAAKATTAIGRRRRRLCRAAAARAEASAEVSRRR